MKNKIRSEIVKIANQILSEAQNFDTEQMKRQVGQLYEKLSVLAYLEIQLKGVATEEQEKSLDSKSFREENWFKEPEPVPQSQHSEDLVEPLMEKIKDIVAQMPEETQHVDELLEKVLPKKTLQKNDLEEFASHYPDTPIFERKEPSKGIDVVEKESSTTFPIDQSIKTPPISSENQLDKPRSLNDKLNKGLNIGLNDRIAFINHLFDGNAEEYGSVLSKIGEMNSFDEASSFIIESIKPKFGDWHNKDEYSERFVAIVEKSFS